MNCHNGQISDALPVPHHRLGAGSLNLGAGSVNPEYGTVDLAFLDDGAWTIIDFKTDQELTKGLDVYRRQVALYARAINAATGTPARAVLLRV